MNGLVYRLKKDRRRRKLLSNIQRIDIEFHSKCNRFCDWCPNKFIDRHSEDRFLDLKVFKKLIEDLYNNGFGTKQYRNNAKEEAIISFLGYQEPLLQSNKLKEYISIVKEIFYDRNIVLLTNTNGDYFKEECLNNLVNLSILNVMDYDCKGREYWEKKLKENKCVIIKSSETMLYAIHKNINLIQVSLNWTQNHLLENRGGTFKPEDLSSEYKWLNECKQRDYPCVEPSYYINVYHDGNVTPCCHIRPDNEKHKKFILGNIYDTSIVDIFYGEKASQFRKIMTSTNYLNYFDTCKNCQKSRKYKCEFKEGEEFPKILSTKESDYKENDKNISDSGYSYLRNRKKWTENQISVWEKSKKYYLREIKKNGKLFPNSFYNIKMPGFDLIKFKKLYENYMKNWDVLYNFYNYTFIDKITPDIIDITEKDITFEQFSFTASSLLNEYKKNRGFYQPFLAYKEKNANKITITAGRHRRVALKYGQEKEENFTPQVKVACFFLDQYDPNFIDKIFIPKDLYDNILQDLNLYKENYDKDYYLVEVSNAVDIWIIMKIMEKEIDFFIEYYYDNLMENNILPSSVINKEIF